MQCIGQFESLSQLQTLNIALMHPQREQAHVEFACWKSASRSPEHVCARFHMVRRLTLQRLGLGSFGPHTWHNPFKLECINCFAKQVQDMVSTDRQLPLMPWSGTLLMHSSLKGMCRMWGPKWRHLVHYLSHQPSYRVWARCQMRNPN